MIDWGWQGGGRSDRSSDRKSDRKKNADSKGMTSRVIMREKRNNVKEDEGLR